MKKEIEDKVYCLNFKLIESEMNRNILLERIKTKDELIENFLTSFKDAIIYGFTISEYNELLNQYNQRK